MTNNNEPLQEEDYVVCRACGFRGLAEDYNVSLGLQNDIRCPTCSSTNNQHNDNYRDELNSLTSEKLKKPTVKDQLKERIEGLSVFTTDAVDQLVKAEAVIEEIKRLLDTTKPISLTITESTRAIEQALMQSVDDHKEGLKDLEDVGIVKLSYERIGLLKSELASLRMFRNLSYTASVLARLYLTQSYQANSHDKKLLDRLLISAGFVLLTTADDHCEVWGGPVLTKFKEYEKLNVLRVTTTKANYLLLRFILDEIIDLYAQNQGLQTHIHSRFPDLPGPESPEPHRVETILSDYLRVETILRDYLQG